jgi:multidrug efflux pump subunit AcrA (membrane-fusion protein)
VNAKLWILSGIVIAAAGIGSATYFHEKAGAAAAKTAPTPPQVVVSKPLIREVDRRLGFLGQFSAVERVELRAQVGGTLTEIHFKDGDIVHKGDLLFVIDPRPYEYRAAQTTAQLESATARLEFAKREFARPPSTRRKPSSATHSSTSRIAALRHHSRVALARISFLSAT